MFILIAPKHPMVDTSSSPGRFQWWLLTFMVISLGVFLASSDFFQSSPTGKPTLSPDRAQKLARELDELENAQQYVLKAARNGSYPCYHCAGKSTILLKQGEVWKYGVTRKGEKGRYGKWHIDMGLVYLIQYEGPLQECLRREKINIYNYALLPENQARTVPLIRPPGNKQDN